MKTTWPKIKVYEGCSKSLASRYVRLL